MLSLQKIIPERYLRDLDRWLAGNDSAHNNSAHALLERPTELERINLGLSCWWLGRGNGPASE